MKRAPANRDQLASIVALGAGAIAVVVVLIIALSGGTTHTLYAGFDNAIQMTPGQQVRIAGRPVGELGSIRLDKQTGTAVVQLNITDSSVWPLPKGSYAVARWGSTTAYLGRYTEIIPGPKGNPPLPNGGILTPQQDQTAFELDQAYNIFRGRTAGDTQTLLNNLGKTLGPEGPSLNRGLAASPYGLNQTADLLQQLSRNDYDLRTLAQAGDTTLSALNARNAQLQGLVTHAANTFNTFAQHTAAEQQALSQAPSAFNSASTTFARLDTSLTGLTTLVNDLRPGAPALARLAGTAATTLRTLRTVAPEATQTLRSGIAAAPNLTNLFTAGTQALPATTTAVSTFTPMFACLRPYTPDIAGFLTTWPGFTSHYDAGGHYGRAFELTVIPALYPGTLLNSQQAMALSPGLTYAFPRPPGMNDGHPYFVPQCGITSAALNPADDPEGAAK
jgi:phospholipid/cholesterol/gamma-HCH transport system substrate-binding protein